MGIKWWLVFALLFLVVTSVYAAIDHGLLGVADDAVVSILQITPGDPDNPNNAKYQRLDTLLGSQSME
ncbi:MAG: hypothetical protein MZV70_14390 [Desulfobacterales bacterium]|nr:hypothetical protein [Desulfobacterales bacterium]